MQTKKKSDTAQRKRMAELRKKKTNRKVRGREIKNKKNKKQKCLLSVFFVLGLLGML